MKTPPIHAEVTPRRNETTESLIRRFAKKVKKEGIMELLRERQRYIKPSDKKRKIKNKQRREKK